MINSLFDHFIMACQGIYSALSYVLGYGWALIAFSFLTTFLISPLGRWASSVKKQETDIQQVLTPQIQKIKDTYEGKEEWLAIRRLYSRYRYHPLSSILLSIEALVQLPLLFVVFWVLSTYESLKGVSFLGISDLSQPDHLLFGLAFLPIVMTIINVITATISPINKKEKIQSYFIAVGFCILLYTAPSALLIYWTCNNFLALFKVLIQKTGKFKIPSFTIDQKAFAIFLTILVPPFYIWSHNITFYGIQPILFSSFVLIIIALTAYFFVYLLGKYTVIFKEQKLIGNFSYKKINNYKKYFNKSFFVNGFYLLILSLLFYTLSKTLLKSISRDSYPKFLIIIFIVYLLLYKLKSYKLINVILTIQIFFIILFGFYNYENEKRPARFVWPGENISDYDSSVFKTQLSLKLKYKPNIYYFICESYNHPSVIEKEYKYDIKDFIKYLKDNDFVVYDNIYSNGTHTLATLTSLFSMGSRQAKTLGNLDVSLYDRFLISGGEGNNLMRILKENEYETSFYLKGNRYFFKQKGKYLDNTDITNIGWLKEHLIPLFILNKKLNFLKNYVEQDSVKILRNFLTDKNKSNRPQAFFHHLNKTFHTATDGSYTFKQKKEWVNSMNYQNAIEDQNHEIKRLVDMIIEKNPNSVIILLGDHGAGRLRGYSWKNLKTLKNEAYEDGETLQDAIEDLYYVFAAIRMPDKSMKIDSQFSSANIFAKIFVKTNPDLIIKTYMAPNISVWADGRIILNEGEINKDF